MTEKLVLAARRGVAVPLRAGEVLEIVNPSGSQVVDTWAVRPDDVTDHLSMQHTRSELGRLVPRVGDELFSNQRVPIMTLLADTSPGTHDTLIPSCDQNRYRRLGFEEPHDNCCDNFADALTAVGSTPPPLVPAPLNLFMNVPWGADGRIRFEAPASSPGDSVQLRAETKLVVVLSACPQDLLPVNGTRRTPTEVHYRTLPRWTG